MRFRKRYRRVVKRLALFPIKAYLNPDKIEHEWRWLEIVYLDQYRDWLFGIIPTWTTLWFVKKEDYDAYISKIKKEKENG